MTVTLITLLKRRADLTKEEFIHRYDTSHRLIGEQVLSGYATRYVRRFVFPVDSVDDVHDPDVILEIDFPDAARRDAFFASLSAPGIMEMIEADEETLFDRTRNRSFTIEEHPSHMPPLG
jgi:hypothetical protein